MIYSHKHIQVCLFIDVAGRLRGSYASDYLINEVKFLGTNEALAITKEGVILLKMN